MMGTVNRLNKSVRLVKALFLDLIFPLECLGCGREGSWLCSDCFYRLRIDNSQFCLHCHRVNDWGGFCRSCRPLYHLNGVSIAGDYDNKLIAAVIKNLKYRFARALARDLGRFLILFIDQVINQQKILLIQQNEFPSQARLNIPGVWLDFKESIIIPVPLHRKRERWRGFNQAGLLAAELAKHFSLPIIKNKLIRTKHKKAQVKLKEKERFNNIKNCFAWQGEGLDNKNIILVDDVVTTGATLNECARTLKQAGAGEVWGLVVAKG